MSNHSQRTSRQHGWPSITAGAVLALTACVVSLWIISEGPPTTRELVGANLGTALALTLAYQTAVRVSTRTAPTARRSVSGPVRPRGYKGSRRPGAHRPPTMPTSPSATALWRPDGAGGAWRSAVSEHPALARTATTAHRS